MKSNFHSQKNFENNPNFLNKKKWRTLSLKESKMPKISKQTLKLVKSISNKPLKINSKIENISLKNFLSSLSMKEKYEDLLTRNGIILPPKYKLLLKKQNYLDLILSTNIEKENYHSYELIKNYFKNSTNLNFDTEDFQKILFITPFFYIFQSREKLDRTIELLFIDIPEDYEKRMKVKYGIKTNFILLQTPRMYEVFKGNFDKVILDKRNNLFKKILENITVEQHEEFLKENHFNYFDPIKCKTWHHLFDLDNVKEIGKFNLVENNIKQMKKLNIR